MDHVPFLVLVGLLAYQQVYWSKLTQKLVDKLMSRNYHEYKQAEGLQPIKGRAKAPEEVSEDLGVLNDFQPL